jgi:hypothetical protein
MDRLLQAGNAGHINAIPTCPSGAGVPYEYEVSTDRDSFTLICRGYHHFQVRRIPEGFPQYTASGGLREHP